MDKQPEMKERKISYMSEYRAEEVEGVKKIKGYPILFNVPGQPYRGSSWSEIVDQRALDDVDFTDLRLLVNHEDHLLLARAGINMVVEKDEKGLYISADIPNTTLANDTWELVQKGIVDAMSFRFWADRWEIDDLNKVERIMHITDVPEVSLVTWPAYRQTVAVATEEKADTRSEEGIEDIVPENTQEAEKRAKASALLDFYLSI